MSKSTKIIITVILILIVLVVIVFAFTNPKKGLNENTILEISKRKQEQEWVLQYRKKAYASFLAQKNPDFGPPIPLDFSKITYYKSEEDKIASN